MVLVVEDGTGLANAESYISVADADTYHAYRTAPAGWASASEPDKERYLRMATEYLGMRYGTAWLGSRINSTMALDWPRFGVWDEDGFPLDSDAVPLRVPQATAEAALRVQQGDELLADVTEADLKRKKVKAGSVVTEKEYVLGQAQTTRYVRVERLVAPLIGHAMRVWRT